MSPLASWLSIIGTGAVCFGFVYGLAVWADRRNNK